jgi:hypothetical protein
MPNCESMFETLRTVDCTRWVSPVSADPHEPISHQLFSELLGMAMVLRRTVAAVESAGAARNNPAIRCAGCCFS